MGDVPQKLVDKTRAEFFGWRKPVLSQSGLLLYQSNDTPANSLWNLLERTILPARSRDIVLNRFPIKDIWDALALEQVFLRPDFDLRQKLNCLRFYFDGGGINNLCATVPRAGNQWFCLSIAIALDLAAGGEGEYAFTDNCLGSQRRHIVTPSSIGGRRREP